MKYFFYISIFLFGGTSLLLKNESPNNPPKYLAVKVASDAIRTSQLAFSFNNPDTLLSHEMYLLKDEHHLPLLYYADIQTPVCIDGLCKPLYIEMYWDLTGQYVGFGEYPEQRLSKYDHDLFESADYLKLHELLSNQHSILGRRKKKALYNIQQTRTEKIKFKGKEIDGVSGATKKEVKDDIVEGALYSCYTLWHLAYGDAVQKIKNQLPLIYTDTLSHYFLNSEWENYQSYAVKQLPKEKFEESINELIPILQQANPLIRAYILKKMPKKLFGHSAMEAEFYPHFADLDFNSKTLLIKGLAYSNSSVALELSKHLTNLSKNQLQTFLQQIKERPALQSELLVQQLMEASKDSSFSYAYLIKVFLEKDN